MKSRIFSSAVVLFAAILGLAFMSSADQVKPWSVPDKYAKMENPVKFDKKVADGLWVKHCKSCHGKDGLGDDFTTKDFQKQTDGALFYKTLKGRDDMPSYEKKIPDQEDIWQLVHLIRTFK